MPNNLVIACFVLATVLLLVGLLGGNFKIFTAEVAGSVGPTVRMISILLAVALFGFCYMNREQGDHRTPAAPSSDRPGAADSSPGARPPPSIQDPKDATVAAMQWLGSRCGPGIEFVVSSPPGSKMDGAARAFAHALSNSGLRPAPVVNNFPGAFVVNGSFSLDKIDEWYRTRASKDGCSLTVVPLSLSEQFARPQVQVFLDSNAYGVVLPRGVVTDAASNWNSVWSNSSNDPDFKRELARSGLQVKVIERP